MDLDKVVEHIKYLKSKTDRIKGVKINYHEKYVSQIEAVITRGDSSLCKYIEALYKKGCYLDGWSEYFDKNVWAETASECGFTLKERAERHYELEDTLPWDFLNTGVNKKWLQCEYKKAFTQPEEMNFQPTCQNQCVSCGVCFSLHTGKILDKPYKSKQEFMSTPKTDPSICTKANNRQLYKYRLKISKKGVLKYFSHLDWQNTFLKTLSRCNLDIAFSMGYNPTMKVSMGVALPLFIESEGELIDIELLTDTKEDTIKEELSKNINKNAKVLEVHKLDKSAKSIDTTVYWAEYKVQLYKNENIKYNVEEVFSSDEILLTKKNKKGLEKTINIKNSIKSYRFEDDCLLIVLRTGQQSELPTVRIDDFMQLVSKDVNFDIVRTRFFDEKMIEL